MSECIIFNGYRQNGGTGYGQRTVNGVRWLAHRYAFTVSKGPIPEGKMVTHNCDNKGCVNPDHLSIGDASTNGKEAWDRGLSGNQNTRKTSCPKCSGPFTYSKAVGGRYCRKCKTQWQRAARNQGGQS